MAGTNTVANSSARADSNTTADSAHYMPVFDARAEEWLRRLSQQRRNVLNDTQLEAGIVYTGANVRTRRVVSKMLAGEPILLGGLI